MKDFQWKLKNPQINWWSSFNFQSGKNECMRYLVIIWSGNGFIEIIEFPKNLHVSANRSMNRSRIFWFRREIFKLFCLIDHCVAKSNLIPQGTRKENALVYVETVSVYEWAHPQVNVREWMKLNAASFGVYIKSDYDLSTIARKVILTTSDRELEYVIWCVC